jgi:acyl-CoA synthetase (AMP-forming)/AMP-acid ligase II
MLATTIYRHAKTYPDRLALVFNDQPFTYAEFARRIESVRRFLAPRALRAGRVAVVLIDNLLDAWTATLALRTLGLTTIQIHEASSAAVLALRRIDCWVVSDREQGMRKLDGVAPGLSGIIALPIPVLDGPHPGDIPAALDDASAVGGHIEYTSGTTGHYKKVLLRGDRWPAMLDRLAASFGMSDATAYSMLSFPLWTAAGFGYPAATWHVGGVVRFDQQPFATLRLMERPFTHAFLIPAKLRELLVQGIAPRARLQAEICVAGGAVSSAQAERLSATWVTRVHNRYGSTEVPAVLRSIVGEVDDIQWMEAYPGRIVEIVDPAGNPIKGEVEGDLRVRLDDLDASEYLDDPQTTARFFRDGFFYPGDRAVQRADGRIQVLGRASDVLNVRGNKVASGPVEEQLRAQLEASAVCLFSGLDASGRDRLVLVIESATHISRERIKALRGVPAFERIVSAFGSWGWHQTREFPRTPGGMSKIDRNALKRSVFERGVSPE